MAPAKAKPDRARGAAAAQQVLREEGYAHISEIEIEDFVRLRGITVRNLHLTGCEARLARRGPRAILSVSDEVTYVARRRFVIAHELGHFEVHKDLSNLELALCTAEQISDSYDGGPEQEANAFAAEFLMPSPLWTREVDVPAPSLGIVEALSKRYGVSLTAAAIRFVELSPERCACVFSRADRISRATKSKSFGHWIPDGKLMRGSLASRFFRSSLQASESEYVPADAWLENPAGCEEIIEDLRVISSDSTLSLLWLRDAGDDEE